MDYVNMNIRVIADPQEKDSYLVNASTTGTRTAQGRFSFSMKMWESVEQSLTELRLREAALTEEATQDHTRKVHDFGRYLFEHLIDGEVRDLYDRQKQNAASSSTNSSKALRLRLTLVPLELVVLPWEIMFDDRHSEYLCLTVDPEIILIRGIGNRNEGKGRGPQYDPPLRIVGMIADPRDLPLLQSQKEKEIIGKALQQLEKEKKAHLEWKQGTVSEFNDLRLGTERLDVFHFTGHGRFEESTQQGQLAFEIDGSSRPKYIPATSFCQSLPRNTKLVVLNACDTAVGNPLNRFSNIAHSLAIQKIPAVVAMQFKILDIASTRFSKVFYTHLAQGAAIDEAVAEARREIHKTADDPDRFDWAAPIMYVSSSNLILIKSDHEPMPTQQKQLKQIQPEQQEEITRDIQEQIEREVQLRLDMQLLLERERIEREAKERLERERQELLERERIEREAKERLERERQELLERERIEREAKERLEREQQEQQELGRKPSALSSKVAPFIEKGNALFVLERYEDALEAYEQAVDSDQDAVVTFHLMGDALFALRRYKKALGAYEHAARLDRNSGVAHIGRGKALFALKRPKDALEAYKEAVDRDPNNAVAHTGKGDSLFALKYYQDALEAYKEATRLDPNNAVAHTGRGNALLTLKRYEDALEAYEQAVDRYPNNAAAYRGMAMALYRLNREMEAEEAEAEALRLSIKHSGRL